MSAAPLTANGSVPPRPGNAFALYKEKLRVVGEFLKTDTSTAAVTKMWKELPKSEKDKLTREAKERKAAFEKQYPNWNRAPKNGKVAANLEGLRSSGQLPRVAQKMSLAAGMPVARRRVPLAPAPVRRVAAAPPRQPDHQQNSWIQSPDIFVSPRQPPPRYGAHFQHPELQENQEPARMYVSRNVTHHQYNPY